MVNYTWRVFRVITNICYNSLFKYILFLLSYFISTLIASISYFFFLYFFFFFHYLFFLLSLIFMVSYIVVWTVEITNKMQPCNSIYYSKIYWRLNMFRAACLSHHQELQTVFAAFRLYTHVVTDRCPGWVRTQPGQRPVTTCVYKPEAANTVWSFWWWAVCRSKHVEPSINFGIIYAITRLHLVGYFYWFLLSISQNM